MQSQKLGEEHAEFKNEADQREKDLRMHIEHLERKDYVVSSLLELMVQRTNFLQDQLEKSSPGDNESETAKELKNLQEILSKEREKAKIVEDQFKSGALSIPRPMLSDNERSRLKEIDVLKSLVRSFRSRLTSPAKYSQSLSKFNRFSAGRERRDNRRPRESDP